MLALPKNGIERVFESLRPPCRLPVRMMAPVQYYQAGPCRNAPSLDKLVPARYSGPQCCHFGKLNDTWAPRISFMIFLLQPLTGFAVFKALRSFRAGHAYPAPLHRSRQRACGERRCGNLLTSMMFQFMKLENTLACSLAEVSGVDAHSLCLPGTQRVQVPNN